MVEEFQESDMDQLLVFLARCSPDHPELGEGDIVRWQKCFRFVSKSKGKIVGYIAQIPQQYKYGEKGGKDGLERIGWGVTLVVDTFESLSQPTRLKSAYVHELLTRIEKNEPWQFGAVGVVPEIEEPYRRRGHAVRRDCAKMYGRFLRPRKALKYMNKSSAYAPLMSVGNVLFGSGRRVDKNSFEKIERFDPAWDDIWDGLMFDQFELYGVRKAEFLNYKLTQPNREYHAYLHKSNEAIDGYIVYRHASHRARDLNLVKVCDLVGTYKAKLELVRLAMKFAYDMKAYGIVAIGANEEEKMYRKAGMYVARPYVIAMPVHISAKMHVTFFDSDLDNLW